MLVSDGVPHDQRLVGRLFGIGEGEADEVVVVCAAAEESLLAPDGARVGAAVEAGGRGVGGWIVGVNRRVITVVAWEWPHCFGRNWWRSGLACSGGSASGPWSWCF